MTDTINRMLVYITMMLFAILSLSYAPDMRVAGWVTGYASIGMLAALAYFGVRIILERSLQIVRAWMLLKKQIASVWQYYRKASYGDTFAMSFFIGAIGIGIFALELNEIGNAVSQATGIISPAHGTVLTFAYALTALFLGALIAALPENRSVYYAGVGMIIVYCGFAMITTANGTVSGRGLLAILIISMAAYFSFKSMVQHGVNLELKNTVRHAANQQAISAEIIAGLTKGHEDYVAKPGDS